MVYVAQVSPRLFPFIFIIMSMDWLNFSIMLTEHTKRQLQNKMTKRQFIADIGPTSEHLPIQM